MKNKISLILLAAVFITGSAFSQTNQSWSASGNGSAYDELSSAATGAGRNPQSPCNHSGVSKQSHITFVDDPVLNSPVYSFQLHTVDGNNTSSGCNLNTSTRGRNELIYETPVYYQKVQYKWKMKLAADFKVTNQFGIFHLHQLKYDDHPFQNEPMFTLSAVNDFRGKDLAIITSQDLNPNQPILGTRTPISTLAGKWLDIEEIVVFQKIGTGFGKYGIRMIDVTTGEVLLEYINNAIGTTKFGVDAARVEQKWGLYRDQVSDLKDETILYNDFEINYLADNNPIVFSVPQANDDSTQVQENSNNVVIDVLTNDLPQGNQKTIVGICAISTSSANCNQSSYSNGLGSATIVGSTTGNTIRFDPASNQDGTFRLKYKMSRSDTSAVSTAILTVVVNDVPLLVPEDDSTCFPVSSQSGAVAVVCL